MNAATSEGRADTARGTAAVWWFEQGGCRAGPVATQDLRARVLALELTAQTLVWRDGMQDWQPLASVPELAALSDELRLAGPWPRYFARLFDACFVTAVLMFTLTLVTGQFLGARPAQAFAEHPWVLVAWILVGFPLFDAVLAAIFGNTPGKAMLGVRVVDARGRRASLPRYFVRNLFVSSVGFGCGLGLVAIGVQLWQFLRVRNGQAAVYDPWVKCRVLGRPVSDEQTIRFVVAASVLLGVSFVGMLASGRMVADASHAGNRGVQASTPARGPQTKGAGASGEPVASAAAAASPAPGGPIDTSFVWRNPVTQTAVRIEGIWMYTEANNRSGDRISLFATEDGQAMVTLGADVLGKASLSQYVQGFMRANADKYVFDDPGRIVRSGAGTGGSKWVAVARSRKHADVRMQFEVVQRGQRFWYLAVNLSKPYDKHARAVDTLRATLQRSIGDGSESSL